MYQEDYRPCCLSTSPSGQAQSESDFENTSTPKRYTSSPIRKISSVEGLTEDEQLHIANILVR